jgi:RNA polymerase sigma-70 factor
MTAQPLEQFRHQHDKIIGRLYTRSGAQKWKLSAATFAAALHRSYARRSEAGPPFDSAEQIEAFLESLAIEDLALAAACREGNDEAWRQFLASYRGLIEGAAHGLISNSSAARELADSLYADLYGLKHNGDGRNSPFDRYHGRSPLSAWLRTVIARRAADSWRSTKICESIDAVPEHQLSHAPHEMHDPRRARYLAMLCEALKYAFAQLPPAERLRLSYYYLQNLTLAQIGALGGEHESTVSRKLNQTRQRIREEVEHHLASAHHLSADEISLCFEYATEDWPFNLAEVLAQGK